MNRHRSLKLIALLSLAALPLGTVACSNGSSPTEPVFADLDEPAVASSTSSLSSVSDESRGRGRGGDDKGTEDKGGNNRGDNRGKGGRGGRGGEDDNPRGQRGQEFEGAVVAVGPDFLTLAGGVQVVVNGQTQWIARGDLHSLSEVARAVAANRPTRAEGRGTRQANGSFLAQTLKVEVDD